MKANRRYFIRLSLTNDTENGLYTYDFSGLYDTLISKYDRVLLVAHDKDKDNIHVHICLQNDNPIRFDTLKNLMPYGQITPQRGTNSEVYDYLLHRDKKSIDEGKTAYNPEDVKTNVNIEEWLKVSPGIRSDLDVLVEAIKDGASYDDCLDQYPNTVAKYMQFTKEYILRNKREQFGQSLRKELEVVYIYGNPGVGKTRTVYDKHTFREIHRISDYDHSGLWDSYLDQDVLLLDEFTSQFKLTYLLQLLDIYPMELQARYVNKQACFTKVYIISNLPLEDQYQYTQQTEPIKFQALLRRITKYYNMTDDGSLVEKPKRFNRLYKGIENAVQKFGNLVQVQ
jgi:hypothetical protein